MSIILFFGSCFLVLCVSTIYVIVGFRNLIKVRKERMKFTKLDPQKSL